ncbi:PTS system, glucose-specific IIABC component [Mycoplasmopsis canis UF31]|uniref:PTS sugar transporter subunit IIA n=1 Tax=Mycoplasmopsis canis TaxID=29555 RepID=UPI00025AEC54|nr:PTS glucose transporter subunit IIA [Mycoplasmopsis canis]EIE40354.1 PTS system, glucose-specific IIABC component [Mycoplasmopsis canis UF31]
MGFFSSLFKKKISSEDVRLYPVYPGKLKMLNEVNDPVFSIGAMGEGFAIEFSESAESVILKAPVSGKLELIFPTKHAYAFESQNGIKVLLHIGVDTVNLQGEGFEPLVEVGKEVKAGEPLVKVDLLKIRSNNYITDAIVTILPESNIKGVVFSEYDKNGIVEVEQAILTVDK